MASARSIRQAVRAQIEADIAARSKAALAVATAWSKLAKAQERIAAAEQEVITATTTASAQVPLTDIARFANIPLQDLRRVMRSANKTQEPPTESSIQLANVPAPARAAEMREREIEQLTV